MRLAHAVPLAACAGCAAALLAPASPLVTAVAACAALLLRPPLALAVVVAICGWWWGTHRVVSFDRSVLAPRIGTAERAVVDTLEPAHTTPYAVRVRALVRRWGALRPHEPVLLELPPPAGSAAGQAGGTRPDDPAASGNGGRAPPQGARLSLVGVLRDPGSERGWLRLHGIHVVLRASGGWRRIGSRNHLADRLHAWLARASVPGLAGERRAVLEGVVLGEDQGLSDELRQRFRASGLYHLLAVSGGNVIVVAGGASMLALALGLSRVLAEAAALAAIAGYVLAVGPQPSVLRAGIVGAIGCLAWITGRERDRIHALLLAGAVLLAWSPLTLLDPGFQLSFAAVAAIFVATPRLATLLEGYPLPRPVRDAVAVSAPCGVVTAPISWAHFHQIPLVTVPANVAAAPVVGPMLALALLAALLPPIGPLLASLNGVLAAYLAACARTFGGLPGAQVRSPVAAAALAAGALLAAAYAWRHGERPEAGLSPHGNRPAEDRARGTPTA